MSFFSVWERNWIFDESTEALNLLPSLETPPWMLKASTSCFTNKLFMAFHYKCRCKLHYKSIALRSDNYWFKFKSLVWYSNEIYKGGFGTNVTFGRCQLKAESIFKKRVTNYPFMINYSSINYTKIHNHKDVTSPAQPPIRAGRIRVQFQVQTHVQTSNHRAQKKSKIQKGFLKPQVTASSHNFTLLEALKGLQPWLEGESDAQLWLKWKFLFLSIKLLFVGSGTVERNELKFVLSI